MDKKTEKEQTEKGKKRKALQEELVDAKKKVELESVMRRLGDNADKKAKEAEKMSDAAAMKALLMESNGARDQSRKIQKKDIPAQVIAIQALEQKIAKLD